MQVTPRNMKTFARLIVSILYWRCVVEQRLQYEGVSEVVVSILYWRCRPNGSSLDIAHVAEFQFSIGDAGRYEGGSGADRQA